MGVVGFGLGAALIAAVCTGTVLGIGYSVVESLPYFHESDLDVRGGLWFVAINATYVSFFIALPTILLVALPHVLLSVRLCRVSMIYYVVSGTVIGLAAVIAIGIVRRYRFPSPSFQFDADTVFFLIAGAVCGAIAAFAFWKTAKPMEIIAKGNLAD